MMTSPSTGPDVPMHCSYCGAQAKTTTARFCHACRKAFWDLSSPGEKPPVTIHRTTAEPGLWAKRLNIALVGLAVLGLIGFAWALYLPAFRNSPASGQEDLVIEGGLVVLGALLAWSYAKWSVIVSLGVGFALTIMLDLGESALRTYMEPAAPVTASRHKGSATSASSVEAPVVHQPARRPPGA